MTRYFIDMDGTIAEFKESTMDELLSKGYFENLRPNENMLMKVKNLALRNKGNVYILSSVLKESKFAEDEKNAWLDRYLPEIDKAHRIFSKCGEDKSNYVPDINKNDILLDDYTENLLSWEKAGGTGVKALNGINGKGRVWKGARIC